MIENDADEKELEIDPELVEDETDDSEVEAAPVELPDYDGSAFELDEDYEYVGDDDNGSED